MIEKDIKSLLKDVNKRSPNNNIWFTSIRMTNAYLTYHFNGTENEIMQRIYARHLFSYILEFLNDSKNLTGQKFNLHVIENFINEIRIDTYDLRKSMLIKWINRVTEKKKSKSNLVQYLLTFYPSVKYIKKVREELGLNYAIA